MKVKCNALNDRLITIMLLNHGFESQVMNHTNHNSDESQGIWAPRRPHLCPGFKAYPPHPPCQPLVHPFCFAHASHNLPDQRPYPQQDALHIHISQLTHQREEPHESQIINHTSRDSHPLSFKQSVDLHAPSLVRVFLIGLMSTATPRCFVWKQSLRCLSFETKAGKAAERLCS